MKTRTLQLSGGYRFLFLSLLGLLVVYPVLSNVERAMPWIDGVIVAGLEHQGCAHARNPERAAPE